MARTIESVYREIASVIVESIPGSWVEAWIKADLEEDNAEFEFMFRKTAGGKPVSFAQNAQDRSYDVFLRFTELRDILMVSGKKPARGVTFRLEEGGKFKVEFSYE